MVTTLGMGERVRINPKLLDWAIQRSGISYQVLKAKFPLLDEWKTSDGRDPTFKQIEEFARKTMTPFGYFFLSEPPIDRISIPDFRTVGDIAIESPSPNLIETLQDTERRQKWMSDYRRDQGFDRLKFGKSTQPNEKIKVTANRIRERLRLKIEWARECKKWEDALGKLRESIEDIGVLVSITGIVGLNTHRKLDTEEFRGFAICDDYAPLIFVNGADAKSAQVFTIAHELAHIWLGEEGISNLIRMMPSKNEIEVKCNKIAAEFLLPEEQFKKAWASSEHTKHPFINISRHFKVSPLVVARRAHDLKKIKMETFIK
ncbi:MAG: ImmA/IrrE family metallo-endopeptidase [candidate division Zixibacteria bacterium]|nr:ImmA/IrrE family metallo-endopeptidase [candidate division Zixibacteria bacterium]